MQLLILADGSIRCLYGEEIDLAVLGPLQIGRASRVEPTTDGRWIADLAPVDGPKHGPFDVRSQALAAEANWLVEHWLIPVGG
jgi:hypothetical protein